MKALKQAYHKAFNTRVDNFLNHEIETKMMSFSKLRDSSHHLPLIINEIVLLVQEKNV